MESRQPTLAQKLGWTINPQEYESFLDSSKAPPRFEYLVPTKKADIVLDASRVANCYYLLGNNSGAIRLATEVIAAVLDLFYGDWTKAVTPQELGHPDPDFWRTRWTWMQPFSQGLAWASAVGDWRSFQRIAEFPIEECSVDPSFTREDKAVYLAMAFLLSGRDEPLIARQCECVRRGKKEKPKLIVPIVNALLNRESDAFRSALEGYLRYFAKREFKRRALDRLLCYDGTTLMNFGRREGLEFKVPAELSDYLITLSVPGGKQ